MGRRFRKLGQHRALIVFMMGHFTVDMFGGLLPMLYPLMATQFTLSNTDIGFIALAYTAASSLSQPLFGYLADRFGSRTFAVLSMVWSAVMVGIAGFSPTYGFLIFAVMMAGLGSGAYHPQGASNAAAVAGDMRRNTAMSIYTVGGTSGFALGPLIAAVAFGAFGAQGTLAIAPFGLLIALILWQQFRALGLGLVTHQQAERAAQVAIDWWPLVPVMAVVMLRSWVSLSVISFIPIWFEEQGHSSTFYSVLTTLIIAGGATGTLVGGIVADRLGERVILGISLIAATPALIVFALFPGPQSLILGPLFGFFGDMSLSVTLVIAQRLLPGRVGIASGIILGMGFVTGGIGVPITGALADAIGTSHALALTSALMAVAAVVATAIPRRVIRDPRSHLVTTDGTV